MRTVCDSGTVSPVELLIAASALGAALVAGVSFSFTAFAIRALRTLPFEQGVVAMRAINGASMKWPLLSLLTITSLLAIVTPLAAVVNEHPNAGWVAAGAAVFVLGVFLVSASVSVPLNNVLQRLALTDSQIQRKWARYLRTWNAWNAVRLVAGVVAAALFLAALV